MLEDRQGQTVALFQELYPGPALTPALANAREAVPPPPLCRLENGAVVPRARGKAPVYRYAVYYLERDRWVFQSAHPPGSPIPLLRGDYAISALTREGAESLGQRVTIPR